MHCNSLPLVLTLKSIDVYIWLFPQKPTNPRATWARGGVEGIRNKGKRVRWKMVKEEDKEDEEDKGEVEKQEEKEKRKGEEKVNEKKKEEVEEKVEDFKRMK